jgi:hypothetical protein
MSRARTPATGELRGFKYALEPLVHKNEWQLEALQTALARVQRRWNETREKLDALKTQYDEQSQRMSKAMMTRIDPATHRSSLAYLAQQREQIELAQTKLKELDAERKTAREACAAQQQKLDLLGEHRADEERAFAAEALRLQLAEADRDWIARRQWSEGQAAQMVDATVNATADAGDIR